MRNLDKGSEKELRVSGASSRLAGKDDVTAFLSREDVAAALTEVRAESDAKNFPETIYYSRLVRPALLLYPLLPNGEKLPEGVAADKVIVAVKLAIPGKAGDPRDSRGDVEYVINTVAQRKSGMVCSRAASRTVAILAGGRSLRADPLTAKAWGHEGGVEWGQQLPSVLRTGRLPLLGVGGEMPNGRVLGRWWVVPVKAHDGGKSASAVRSSMPNPPHRHRQGRSCANRARQTRLAFGPLLFVSHVATMVVVSLRGEHPHRHRPGVAASNGLTC
jgi:hypothetical protein